MAVFSYLFLNRSLEKWFGSFSARVVNEAQEVQREAVDEQTHNLTDTASLLAAVLKPQSDAEKQADAGSHHRERPTISAGDF